MSRVLIPLRATPSQTLTVLLASQNCRIDLRTKRTGLYFDLYVDEEPVVQGVLCLNLVRLVRRGIVGDLFWLDTRGTDAPTYDGLENRYYLIYDDAL